LTIPSHQKFPCHRKTLPGRRRSYAPPGDARNRSSHSAAAKGTAGAGEAEKLSPSELEVFPNIGDHDMSSLSIRPYSEKGICRVMSMIFRAPK
jgi:hypothetical protein